MDQTARAAYITAMSACCQAKLFAMQEQNIADRSLGRPISYQPLDFENAPSEFGLEHNSVIIFLIGD